MVKTRKIGLRSVKLLLTVRELSLFNMSYLVTEEATRIVRQPTLNSPVFDLNSPDMACNDRGTTQVSGTLKVSAGDTLEPQCTFSFFLHDVFPTLTKG